MQRRTRLTGLLGCALGRGSPSPATPPEVGLAPPPFAEGSPASHPPRLEPKPEALIVGSDRGLEAWDRDGNLARLISPQRSRFPRFIDPETMLVIAPKGDGPLALARGFRLESVERLSGKRSTVSEVPEFACQGLRDSRDPVGGSPELARLRLSQPGDFAVDPRRGFACVSLFDSHREAATFGFELRINLASGAVRRWVDRAPASCVVAGASASGRPAAPCVTPAYDEPEPHQSGFGIGASSDGVVVTKDGQHALLVPGYERELVSPSGAWVLLHGDVTEGDYVHRRLVLLHLPTGSLYPIPEPMNRWPGAIARAGVDTVVETPIEDTREAVGESAIDWLGNDESDELLLIDDLVVRPGQLVFDPKGEIAR